MDDDALLALCHRAVDAVPVALAPVADWRPRGERPGQYAIDLTADRAVLEVLDEAGIGVVSEESGVHRPGSALVAVIDPVDGSTNASRGIPWYASSICILDADGPRVAVVANLANGMRYHAVRGGGAWRGTTRVVPSGCEALREAVVGITGMPEPASGVGPVPGLRCRRPGAVRGGGRNPRRLRGGHARLVGPLGLPRRLAGLPGSRRRHRRAPRSRPRDQGPRRAPGRGGGGHDGVAGPAPRRRRPEPPSAPAAPGGRSGPRAADPA